MTTQSAIVPPAGHLQDSNRWRWKLPGFNLPLNFTPLEEKTSDDQNDCGPVFPSALDCQSLYVLLDDVVICSET